MKTTRDHIKHLSNLVQTGVDALYIYKNLLDDSEQVDLLESGRKLQRLFEGQHPRYANTRKLRNKE